MCLEEAGRGGGNVECVSLRWRPDQAESEGLGPQGHPKDSGVQWIGFFPSAVGTSLMIFMPPGNITQLLPEVEYKGPFWSGLKPSSSVHWGFSLFSCKNIKGSLIFSYLLHFLFVPKAWLITLSSSCLITMMFQCWSGCHFLWEVLYNGSKWKRLSCQTPYSLSSCSSSSYIVELENIKRNTRLRHGSVPQCLSSMHKALGPIQSLSLCLRVLKKIPIV